MSSQAEGRCRPAEKKSLVLRLKRFASSLRIAVRDRRVLLAMDDRMLGDIGLVREDIFYGVRAEPKEGTSPQGTARRYSLLTILVVIVSLAVVAMSIGTAG